MILAPLPIMILTLLANLIHKVFAHVIFGLSACLLGMSVFAWFFMGFILRFKHYGKFSAGVFEPSYNDKPDWFIFNDTHETLFQYKSGTLMLVFYIVMFVMLGLAFGAGGVYGMSLLCSRR